MAPDYVVNAEPQQGPQPQDAHALANGAASDYVSEVFATGEISDKFILALEFLVELGVIHTGALPTVETLPQTPNAATQLKPGVSDILDNEALIRKLSPNSLSEVDTTTMALAMTRMDKVDRVATVLQGWLYGLNAVKSQYQTYLDTSARTVYRAWRRTC